MKTPTPPLESFNTLPIIAPCEHIAGNARFILKAFSLQERFTNSAKQCLVDLTLDLEDGAPVGEEDTLRDAFVELLHSKHNTQNQAGIRIHPLSSEHAVKDLETLITKAGDKIRYITIPKVSSTREVAWARGLVQHYSSEAKLQRPIPFHLLIETHEALNELDAIARLPHIETFDFGLMDYISQCDGVISDSAMRSPEQFRHPLLRATKTRIALTALQNVIIPSHNVTIEFRNTEQTYHDAHTARTEYGFMRMWSIHPSQIEPIINGMLPEADEINQAIEILEHAEQASWGPIEHNGRLHDRASYRYYWNLIRRAHQNT